MLIQEALDSWFEYNQRHTQRTQTTYRGVAKRFSQSISIKTIEKLAPLHVNLYLSKLLAQGLKNQTCNSHLAALKSLANFLEQNYQIANFAAPVKRMRPTPPHQRFLDPFEYEKILAVCKKRKNKDLIITLANTGLRASEMERLTWDNISRDLTLITFVGKGRKRRIVPVNSVLKAVLLRYPRVPKTHIQFTKSRRSQYKLMCRLCQKAGIERAGPHALRHYFATQMLAAGASLTVVSKTLGHHSTTFTESLYIHLHLPTYLRGATEVLCKK